MNNYSRIINELNDKKKNLELITNSGVTEDLKETISVLEGQIEQLERYSELVKFSEDLDSLYDARRNATSTDEIEELENKIDELTKNEDNIKFFSLKYRNDILNIDPEFYKHLRDTYKVEIVTPEKFRRDLGSDVVEESVSLTNEIDAPQVTYDETIEKDNNPQTQAFPYEGGMRDATGGLYGDTPEERERQYKDIILDRFDLEQVEAVLNNYSYLKDEDVCLTIQNVDLTVADFKKRKARLTYTQPTEEVVEAQQPVELFSGDIGEGMPTPEEQFEQATGEVFDPAKHEIVYDGATNEENDESFTPFTIVEKEPVEEVETEEPTEEAVEEKQLPSVIEPAPIEAVEEKSFDEAAEEEFINLTPSRELVEEKQLPAEVETPVDEEKSFDEEAEEEFINLTPSREVVKSEETKPIPVISSDKQAWDPRLTTEQILEALSRDIYEPVGPEYEQFLGELGLSKQTNAEAPAEQETVAEEQTPAPEETRIVPVIEPVQKEEPVQEEEPVEEKQEEMDEPEEDVEVEEIPPMEEAPKKSGRSLESILYSITLDENEEVMDLTKGKRKAITNSRVNVTKSFVNRVKHGNLIYNILGVTSSIIPMFVQSVSRWINKGFTLLHPQATKNYDKIIENLYNLSDEDLEVLRTELTANRATELRNYVSIMPLVHERVANYIEEKYNTPLREEITDIQLEIMDKYKTADQLFLIMESTDDENEKAELMGKINKVSEGSCELINRLRDLKLQLAHNIEGGPGIHTFKESTKAVDNNAQDYGKFFSKKIGLAEAQEFSMNDAALSDELISALNAKDDMSALLSFGDKEIYEYTNTSTKKTWMGYISTGTANWKLMPGHINYNNDPLLGYVFTTISTIGLAKGILTEIHNQGVRKEIEAANQQNIGVNNQINQANTQNGVANQLNRETIDQVHNSGAKLESRSTDYVEGINTMSRDSVVSTRTAGEYNAGDATNWSFNSTYRDLDHASHESVHASYDQANQAFADIQAGIQNGSLDAAGALREAQTVLETMNQSKIATYNAFLETIKTYAPAHPQHDYVPLENYMNDIVNNPTAINNMVDGMVESIQVGQTLQDAVMQVYSPVAAMVTTLPDNIQSFILPLVTQAAITGYLNRLHGKFVVTHPNRDYETEVMDQYDEIIRDREQLKEQLNPEDYSDEYDEDYEDEFNPYEDEEEQSEVEEDVQDEEQEEVPEIEEKPRRRSIFERIRDRFTEEVPEDEELAPYFDDDYEDEEIAQEFNDEVEEKATVPHTEFNDEELKDTPEEEVVAEVEPVEIEDTEAEAAQEVAEPEEPVQQNTSDDYEDYSDIDFDPFADEEPLAPSRGGRR